MSRRAYVFGSAMASQAVREHSQPAHAYNAYIKRTSATPVSGSYRTGPSSSSHRSAHSSSRKPPSTYDSFLKYDGKYGNRAYDAAPRHGRDYEYGRGHDYDYARSHTSTSSGASSHRHDERVSIICHGGGDVLGHLYAYKTERRHDRNDPFETFENRTKAKTEKRVHWADEKHKKPASKTKTAHRDRDDYGRDDRGTTRKSSKSSSSGHRHSSSSSSSSQNYGYTYGHSYDDEIDRRERKWTSSTRW